jgi:DNA-binding MarR family transcriptional regulator
MRSNREHTGIAGDSYRELRLLEEVSLEPNSSQRTLAGRLGIALGVTNILLKSLGKKGYIRIVQVKWRSWIYLLTPSGIARKVQLTFAYVESFLDHYRRIREILSENLEALELDADSTVAIYGQTELAELTFVILRNLGISKIAVIDHAPDGSYFLSLPVLDPNTIAVGDYTKIVIAFPTEMDARRDELIQIGIPPEQIVQLLNSGAVAYQEDTNALERGALIK